MLHPDNTRHWRIKSLRCSFPSCQFFKWIFLRQWALKLHIRSAFFWKKVNKVRFSVSFSLLSLSTWLSVSNSPPEFGGEFGLWKIRLIFDFWTCVRRSSSTTFVSGRRWPSWWCCLRGGPWGGRARFVKFSCCSRTRVVLAPGALSCYRVSRSGPVVTQWDPRHNNKTTILREDSKNFLLWIW